MTTLAGSVSESVLQPEWVDDATLTMISDRSGWWNLYSVTLQGKGGVLHPEDAEFGGPLWQLGARTYGALDEARILAVRTVGDDSLVILDLAVGTSETIDLPLTSIRLGPQSGCRVLLTGGSSSLAGGFASSTSPTGHSPRCASMSTPCLISRMCRSPKRSPNTEHVTSTLSSTRPETTSSRHPRASRHRPRYPRCTRRGHRSPTSAA